MIWGGRVLIRGPLSAAKDAPKALSKVVGGDVRYASTSKATLAPSVGMLTGSSNPKIGQKDFKTSGNKLSSATTKFLNNHFSTRPATTVSTNGVPKLSNATSQFLKRQYAAGSGGTYTGQCHCGKVEFEVKGQPAWTAACHCSICRITHAAPYAELCGYGNDDVRVTKGKNNLDMYNVNGKSQEDRYFCRDCGSKIYSKLNHLDCKAIHLQNLTSPNHGSDGKIDPDFQMGCHIFYASGTVNNYDKKPKFETLPSAFGGDGKELENDYRDAGQQFQFSFGGGQGQCHCGEVQFEVTGTPSWTAACHCSICRIVHSAPYAELCGYDDEKVKITKGEHLLSMYNVNGKSQEDRYFCKKCSTKVYSKLNHLGCKAVHLQTLTIPNHGGGGRIHKDFAMGCHILYGSGTQSNYDKLPKFNTLPTAFGGDGAELPNDHHDTR